MAMKISVVGTGYVGAVTGATFAEVCGHSVLFVDVIKDKVDKIRSGKAPFYEPGLDELLSKNRDKLHATTDFSEVRDSDAIFLCVGTPPSPDGSVDLSQVFSAVGCILPYIQDGKFRVIVTKSTVPPTTGEKVIKRLEQKGLVLGRDFGYASNPEFLREGNAVHDSLHPDRIVVGCADKKTEDVMKKIYSSFQCTKIFTDVRTAEMIKYTANALLATKISFANEIARLCSRLGVDVYHVMDAVALDHRVNREFLNAGLGFGGSCFPKDVKGLISLFENMNIPTNLLSSVLDVNESQPLFGINILKESLGGLSRRTVGVIGLSFKENTDDVRETRAYPLIKGILSEGARVVVYDPLASENFVNEYPDVGQKIVLAKSLRDAIDSSDAIVIHTAWDEVKRLSPNSFKEGQVILDGRRALDVEKFKNSDKVTYVGIGW